MSHRASRCAAAAASLVGAALLAAGPALPDTPASPASPALPPSAWTTDAPSLTAPPVSSGPGVGLPTTPRQTPIAPAPANSAPAAGAGPATSPGAGGRIAPSASGAAGADDIRDIRGPKLLFPLWTAIAIAIAVLLAVAAAYGVWRFRRRARKPRPLTAVEIALQRLEEIRRLMHPSTVREYSIAVSDIVRGYIETEFRATATHQTTEEFLHDLLQSSNAALLTHRNLLSHFLNQCDVAKFAGVSLSLRIMESLHESARRFIIDSSKPTQAAPLPATHDSLPST